MNGGSKLARQLKTPAYKLRSQAKQRAKIAADPERREQQRQYMKGYRKANRDRLNANDAARAKRLAVELRLQRKGLPLSHADQIREHHGYCEICGGEGDGRWKQLNVDHCHATNVFRGLLCSNCNRGIGMFKDNPDFLRKAALYLERSGQDNLKVAA